MPLSTTGANLVCAGLVAVDQLARAFRVKLLARGLNCPTRLLDCFTLNAASDATAAITPLRVGGEPTRFGGMIHAGLNVSDTIALISVEGIMEWLAVLGLGSWIGWRYGSEWWETERHTLVPHINRVLPWIAVIIAVGLCTVYLLRKFVPKLSIHVGGTLRDSLRLARRMPTWAIAVNVPLTVIHIVARIAILPVILATLDSPPAFGTAVVGSLALLYGQNFVPTPSGAGAVELGFLNGAAGDVGPDAASLLVLWRFYTTLVGITLGLAFGLPLYGSAVRRFLLRRRDARRTV